MKTMRGPTLAFAVLALASCRAAPEEQDQRTETLDAPAAIQRERESLPPDVLAQIDSGSAAIRAGDARGALAHYRRATELSPELAAAWFGVYMAHQALGDEDEARAALEKARSLEPGASLMDPR